MTLGMALSEGIRILKAVNLSDSSAETSAANIDAVVLLCHILKCDASFLYAHSDFIISTSKYEKYIKYIKRRANGEPAAYITGQCEFISLPFMVNRSVLIPRPETEILVEEALKLIKASIAQGKKEKKRILDIGTGSGCIAVSLARFIEEISITAVDISTDALKTAENNASLNGVSNKITFIKADVFSGNPFMSKQSGAADCIGYDGVVSNPPYIKRDIIKTLGIEVREYEPSLALDGGVDGLGFYRRILQDIEKYLRPGGFLAVETGYDQARTVAGLMENKFEKISIVKDYSAIERVVIGIELNNTKEV